MNKLGQETLRFALTLALIACILQWAWQMLKPLVPIAILGSTIWGAFRFAQWRRQDW